MRGARVKLKNFHAIKKFYKGYRVVELIHLNNGAECVPFSLFQKDLIDNPTAKKNEISPSTLKVARIAVAKFIDFLSEMGVYENKYHAGKVKLIVKQYPDYLANRIDESYPKLKLANEQLHAFKPKLAAAASHDLHITYVNSFLTLSEKLAREESEILAAKAGIDISTAYKPIFEDIWKHKNLTNSEKSRIRQSKFGACIRDVGGVKLKPSKALYANPGSDIQQPEVEIVDKAFPIDSVRDLINSTSSKRNRAIFSMEACGGLRLSEVLQTRWNNIDLVNGEMQVKPATKIELERALIPESKIKNILHWKGRNTSKVFLIAALENLMWQSLREYQASDEYQSSPLHDFIFVYTRGDKKGQPLLLALDTENTSIGTVNRAFKSACKKADIKPDKKTGYLAFNPHDLRHGYGTYLLNYCPTVLEITDEHGTRDVIERGLPLADVSKLMGHDSEDSTKVYAKKKKDRTQESHVKAHVRLEANGESGSVSYGEAIYYATKAKQCLMAIKDPNEKTKLQHALKRLAQ